MLIDLDSVRGMTQLGRDSPSVRLPTRAPEDIISVRSLQRLGATSSF